MEVIRGLEGASTEMVERNKTIFFPGDPAERVYLIRRGAVRLSRVYESGEEITVALSGKTACSVCCPYSPVNARIAFITQSPSPALRW
jgi:hypothetical protein